ncbi:MAG: hypothetical protein M3Z48_01765 [Lactobacillus sp.]|nr:hypothetical protein [Lactobacillus sp.]
MNNDFENHNSEKGLQNSNDIVRQQPIVKELNAKIEEGNYLDDGFYSFGWKIDLEPNKLYQIRMKAPRTMAAINGGWAASEFGPLTIQESYPAYEHNKFVLDTWLMTVINRAPEREFFFFLIAKR